jgi:hypothetical protein
VCVFRPAVWCAQASVAALARALGPEDEARPSSDAALPPAQALPPSAVSSSISSASAPDSATATATPSASASASASARARAVGAADSMEPEPEPALSGGSDSNGANHANDANDAFPDVSKPHTSAALPGADADAGAGAGAEPVKEHAPQSLDPNVGKQTIGLFSSLCLTVNNVCHALHIASHCSLLLERVCRSLTAVLCCAVLCRAVSWGGVQITGPSMLAFPLVYVKGMYAARCFVAGAAVA